jgi:hypothetical protein
MKKRFQKKKILSIKQLMSLLVLSSFLYSGFLNFLFFQPTTVFADTTSPRFAGNAATAGGGTTWTNPGNATGDTTSTAATSSMGNNTTSSQLILTNFGLTSSDIPADSVINGITIEVEWAGDNTAITDSVVQLTSDGTNVVGSNLAAGTTQTTKAFRSYGGASNMWGTSLTQADLTSSNFGVIIQYAKGGGGTRTVSVYRARVIVDYTPPSITTYTLTTNVTGSGSISRNPDSLEYDENTEVTLTAIPDSGWVFVEWTGDLSGSTNPQNVIMNSNKTVTAVFQQGQATWREPENTATQIAKNTSARLRMQIANDGSVSDSATFRLEYSNDTSGPWTAVVVDSACNSTAAHFRICPSAYFSDLSATTNRLTPVGGYTFFSGLMISGSNPTPSVAFATEEFTELEWNIQATDSATDGGTYYFRVTDAGTAIGTITTYPEVLLEAVNSTFTQEDYRWYQNNNALTPTDAWAGVGVNTPITGQDDPPADGDVLRLRMSVEIGNIPLGESEESFRLQYGVRTETCSAISSWSDLGEAGSGTTWRGFNATPNAGTALSTNPPTAGDLLLLSDRAGTYEEGNPTSVNPYEVGVGERIEYDWVIQHNNAPAGTSYCFRMVRTTGTLFVSYENYPTVLTASYAPESQNWRWFEDAQNVTPSSPLSLENVSPVDVAFNDSIKLRITLSEMKNISGENVKFRLQFSEYSNFSDAVYYVAESEGCDSLDYWCYADGGGVDGEVILETTLSDSDACSAGVGIGCGTHNESGETLSTFTHQAGGATEFEFTLRHAGARANATYFFRVYDATNNEPVLVADSATYPSLSTEGASLDFSVVGLSEGTSTRGITTDVSTSPTLISFGSLPLGTPFHAAHRKIISTNGTQGYQLLMYFDQGLMNSSGEAIPPVLGTNSSPLSWSNGCLESAVGCFGYHAGDDVLSGGSTRFSAYDTYAQPETEPREISYSSGPVINEEIDVVFKVQISQMQAGGSYESSVSFIIVPVF